MKTKLLKSVLLLFLGLLLFIFSAVRIPVLDSRAETYFNATIKKAGLAYATTRVINASVSVIKASELQLEPGGVGVSLAVGQVVDPIDDMTERLSDVLVTAIASLGVQRLFYEIAISLAPVLLAVLMLFKAIQVWFERSPETAAKHWLTGIAVLIIAARLFLPIASLANHFIYEHFFLDDIRTARKMLSTATHELDKLKEIEVPEIDGIAGTIKNSAEFLETKSTQLKHALLALLRDMGDIISNLLKLTWLYAGILIIQVIGLPLVMFWMLIKLCNNLFTTTLPFLIKHASPRAKAT